jgi:hypothetical protein
LSTTGTAENNTTYAHVAFVRVQVFAVSNACEEHDSEQDYEAVFFESSSVILQE